MPDLTFKGVMGGAHADRYNVNPLTTPVLLSLVVSLGRVLQKLQDATASEPLSLEEEHENQLSWRRAHDKLTFIVCAPALRDGDEESCSVAVASRHDDGRTMRGDVNFFLHPSDADPDSDPKSGDGGAAELVVGEVDVMIAHGQHRRHGLGRAAVCALLVFVHRHREALLAEYVAGRPGRTAQPPRLGRLVAKIRAGNMASRALFAALGFTQEGDVNFFGEVTMVVAADHLERQGWWAQAAADSREMVYKRVGTTTTKDS